MQDLNKAKLGSIPNPPEQTFSKSPDKYSDKVGYSSKKFDREHMSSGSFHPGHEKDIPDKKDFADSTTFKTRQENIDKHLGGPLGEHHEGLWEKTKDFAYQTKESIVHGTEKVFEKTKDLFK